MQDKQEEPAQILLASVVPGRQEESAQIPQELVVPDSWQVLVAKRGKQQVLVVRGKPAVLVTLVGDSRLGLWVLRWGIADRFAHKPCLAG